MKIVLLGYMGSGKSTIGKILAADLKLNFLDLDSYIETAEGKTVKAIFEDKGEIYFRKIEAASLREILKSEDNFVLSIGGGTPCYANNMQAIVDQTKNSFYLKNSITELVKRLSSEKSERPLVQNIADDELSEFIGKHLFERSFFYSQASQKVVGDAKSPQEVMQEIKELLR